MDQSDLVNRLAIAGSRHELDLLSGGAGLPIEIWIERTFYSEHLTLACTGEANPENYLAFNAPGASFSGISRAGN